MGPAFAGATAASVAAELVPTSPAKQPAVFTDTASRSHRLFGASFALSFHPLTTEGAGNAGCALHPRPRVQQKSTRVSNHRYTASTGIPCAMVLTAYSALSPVTGLFCHRHPRICIRE